MAQQLVEPKALTCCPQTDIDPAEGRASWQSIFVSIQSSIFNYTKCRKGIQHQKLSAALNTQGEFINLVNLTWCVIFARMKPNVIHRLSETPLKQLLDNFPAVVLVGPRQAGKTTLALEVAASLPASVYLDLESPRDRAKISDIESFCDLHPQHLIILDEVQRIPDLFAPLRGIIDRRRRVGKKTGQFLLLGSASISLLHQSSESLAGRIAYFELAPLSYPEVNDITPSSELIWLRGGFPDSLLNPTDKMSLAWRHSFIRTYLERDIPQLGPRIPSETLRRFWTMLAHNQGQQFQAASLSRGLDVSGITVARYLDLMVDLLLVRRLMPWHSNLGRRLIKAPKIYVRDSGICHALLDIESMNDLLGHPVVGGSWEGFVIEQLITQINLAGSNAQCGYYRTSAGAEVDLVIDMGRRGLWAIEIKKSTSPTLTKGFFSACEDLQPKRKIIVHGGEDEFPMKEGVEARSLRSLCKELSHG